MAVDALQNCSVKRLSAGYPQRLVPWTEDQIEDDKFAVCHVLFFRLV